MVSTAALGDATTQLVQGLSPSEIWNKFISISNTNFKQTTKKNPMGNFLFFRANICLMVLGLDHPTPLEHQGPRTYKEGQSPSTSGARLRVWMGTRRYYLWSHAPLPVETCP